MDVYGTSEDPLSQSYAQTLHSEKRYILKLETLSSDSER